MNSCDFHGLNKEEALSKAEAILYSVRVREAEELWSFITGTGTIQDFLVEWCEDNKLRWDIPSWNLGIIKIDID